VNPFGRYGGETNGTFKADLKQVFGSDNGRVVAIHHNSGERNGKRLDSDCCIVFEVKNGQIVSGREYFFDLHNWDAFWAQASPGNAHSSGACALGACAATGRHENVAGWLRPTTSGWPA
jgi:hypothetical protein